MIIFSLLFVFGNLSLYKMTINKAKRKYILPYLASMGYQYYKIEHLFFFSTGAFKQQFSFGLFFKIDTRRNDFIDITAKKANGEIIKMTVKIETNFALYIRKIEYKEYD